jgi:ectoine hydroxylase-related dioxygenase (phytanoyl-CoA dioxygenase family)
MDIGLPSVYLDPSGRPPADELIVEAADAFRTAGCLAVHDVLDVDLVESLRRAFLARNRRYLAERNHLDAVKVGGRRYMVTVRLRPPFSDPRVYANPVVMRIISELLGDARLFAFGGVLALPDAPAQHLHADSPGLFDDPELDSRLPPYAVSTLIPLIDVENAVTGTTQVWPGTHLTSGLPRGERGFVDPILPRGSVLLMDYRLVHRGTPNPARSTRPILYNVYARPWFRDPTNYRQQAPLLIGPVQRWRVPRAHRALFGGSGRWPALAGSLDAARDRVTRASRRVR